MPRELPTDVRAGVTVDPHRNLCGRSRGGPPPARGEDLKWCPSAHVLSPSVQSPRLVPTRLALSNQGWSMGIGLRRPLSHQTSHNHLFLLETKCGVFRRPLIKHLITICFC